MNKERYWTTLVYTDIKNKNWKDDLQATGLEIAISPLHNKDYNQDGTQKKEHYHILISFNGPTTYNNVRKISKELLSDVEVKPVKSVKGIIRYFTHKDNPEKAQYDENEIEYLNGYDVTDILMTKTELEYMKKCIIQLARELKIDEYADLVNYTIDNSMYDYFKVLSNNTIFFVSYLRSLRLKN